MSKPTDRAQPNGPAAPVLPALLLGVALGTALGACIAWLVFGARHGASAWPWLPLAVGLLGVVGLAAGWRLSMARATQRKAALEGAPPLGRPAARGAPPEVSARDVPQPDVQALLADRTRELRDALQARDENLRLLRGMADQVPNRVSYWARDGYCRYANRGYLDLFGISMDRLAGITAPDLLGADLAAETQARIDGVLTGQPQQYERVRQLGGRDVTLWVQFVPDVADGQVRGYFVVGTDVSEIKRAETRLRLLNDQLTVARDHAEAANRAKTDFLANMSHEIRTPMNAIIGLTHLMQRDAREASQRDRLAKVDQAAAHLLEVVNDVLDLSKIESGKLHLEHTEFTTHSLLERLRTLVAPRVRTKGIELVVDVGPGVPHCLLGDPTRLSQALLNLVANAIKFTEQGAVVVALSVLAGDEQRVKLELRVRDTGVGVPAEQLRSLFSAFHQADSSTTRRFGGTGLGLVITRRLAEQMGGEVGVHSALGQGSEFWFTGWLGRGPEPALPAAPSPWQGARALLVDDLPASRRAIAALAGQAGLLVEAVDTLAAAQLAATSAQETGAAGAAFDLLLLDWPLPAADQLHSGLQLCKAIALPPARVVLLSMADDARRRDAALEAGFAALLDKPVLQAELAAALGRAWGAARSDTALVALVERRQQGSQRRDFAGRRVLLAEDDPINQEMACQLLASAGLEVDLAADGPQAVELAELGAYDLILMDLQMPGLDGLQATAAIRKLPAHQRTPIVAMTANAFGEDRERCLDAGMNDHLAKPVDIRLLFDTLGRWLPKQPVAGASAPLATLVSPAQTALLNEAAGAPAVLERLASASGLDIRGTLLYAQGREDLLERALRQFADKYRDGVPGLEALLAEREAEASARQLHALRGAAGAVGAIEVSARALRIEQALLALVDGDAGVAAWATPVEGLQQALRELCRAITAALQTNASHAPARAEPSDHPSSAVPAPADAQQLRRAIDALAEWLDSGDYRALAAFHALEPHLAAQLPAQTLAALQRAMREHDHQSALALLPLSVDDQPAVPGRAGRVGAGRSAPAQ